MDELSGPLGEMLPIANIQDPEFEAAYGEPFARTLDLDTWDLGENLLELYERLEAEVAQAVAQEDRIREAIRREVFPRIPNAPGAPKGAGVYQATGHDLERVHRGLLFNGGVEACDGISLVHDTIPLTITQIGVALVAYNGQQGMWAHRLFRRDLRESVADPVNEALTLLERRDRRESLGLEGSRLSDLARRGIMTYAERAILLRYSQARWRMGHGSPVPLELLSGLWAAHPDRLQLSLALITELIAYRRFVFVPSARAARELLTIGQALKPLEFAILGTLEMHIDRLLQTGPYRGPVRTKLEQFSAEIGPQVAIGLYRASSAAPPYVFYAHVDHACEAALIVLADSVLQEHRGFPMLLDLADTVCRATLGADMFVPSVQLAYAETGQPFRFLTERETRYR
jgi:hypothetical protein